MPDPRRLIVLAALAFATAAQAQTDTTPDDPNAHIFDPMIGTHRCAHRRTNYDTRETRTYESTWIWERDMRGNAVRDWGDHGGPNLTLRVYDPDARQWHVWYFLGGAGYYAGEWIGGLTEDGRMIFRFENVDYSERPVTSELEYTNVTEDGFDWQSTDIYNDTGERFVDWRISCRKVRDEA